MSTPVPIPGQRRRARRLLIGGLVGVGVLAMVLAFVPAARWRVWSIVTALRGRATVESRLAEYGDSVRTRLEPAFVAAGVRFPAGRITLAAFKEEKRLELWAADGTDSPSHLIKTYPILAASGGPGPKTKEGDGQVPEGLYGIESLNPNSLYHLALRVAYPNKDDRVAAVVDSRRGDLGGNIMIHGSDASIGCLAMGDPAIEELFVAVALTGVERTRVIITPRDLRNRPAPEDHRGWVIDRYAEIKTALEGLGGR
jgi:hypothetical protein